MITHLTFVSSLDYSVGAAAQNRHLAYWRGLSRAGAKVTVLLTKASPSAGSLPVGEHLPTFLAFGGAVVGSFASRPLGLLDALQSATRTLMSGPRSDAIILLDSNPVLLSILLRAARTTDVPVLHERTEFPPALRLTRSQRVLGMMYDTRQLPQFDGIYAITASLLEILMNVGRIRHGRVVDMAVDVDRFPAPSNPLPTPATITYAGSLDPRKDGLPVLVEALGILASQMRLPPGTKVRVAGTGTPTERAELMRMVSYQTLPLTVDLLGHVDRDEIPELLTTSSVLVLPRPDSIQARFGMPTKLGEYLASGRPVVATRVGEIAVRLTDRENSYLAEPGDARSLAQAIETALTDPRSAEVGLAGRRLAQREFSADRAAAQILDLVGACNS